MHGDRGYGLWSAWLVKSSLSRCQGCEDSLWIKGQDWDCNWTCSPTPPGVSSLGWAQQERYRKLQHSNWASEKGHRFELRAAGNVLSQPGFLVRLAAATPAWGGLAWLYWGSHAHTHTLYWHRARPILSKSLINHCHHGNYYLIRKPLVLASAHALSFGDSFILPSWLFFSILAL